MSTSAPETSVVDMADLAFAESRVHDALRFYAGALRAAPQDLYLWYRTAASLARTAEPSRAGHALEMVVEALAEAGQLLLALAAAKDLARVDGDRFQAAITKVAQLYGVESSRLDRGRRAPPSRVPSVAGRPSIALPEGDAETVAAVAAEACGEALQRWRRERGDAVAPVPFHPLLSDLTQAQLIELESVMELRVVAPGQTVIAQGDGGTSMFIVARGTVRVTRDGVELAYLRSGAFFGEMAMLTRDPRTASVVTDGPVLLFALKRDALEKLAERNPEVGAVLAAHTRRRLLQAIVATSPLFEPLEPQRRGELVELFESRVYADGEPVVTEGADSAGLYVVLSGEVRVAKREDGDELKLAQLGPGQVFGEISMIQQRPATATVTAVGRAVVLCLTRELFNEHVAQFPEVLAHAYKLAIERENANLAVELAQPVVVDEVEGNVLL